MKSFSVRCSSRIVELMSLAVPADTNSNLSLWRLLLYVGLVVLFFVRIDIVEDQISLAKQLLAVFILKHSFFA